MSLGTAEVAKIAHLARLAIREEDAPAYARNLSAILELVAQMEKLSALQVGEVTYFDLPDPWLSSPSQP